MIVFRRIDKEGKLGCYDPRESKWLPVDLPHHKLIAASVKHLDSNTVLLMTRPVKHAEWGQLFHYVGHHPKLTDYSVGIKWRLLHDQIHSFSLIETQDGSTASVLTREIKDKRASKTIVML